MADILVCENMHPKALSATLNKSDKKFSLLKLYKNSNFIASKTQIYSFLHNATCFKYRVAANKKDWLDFSSFHIDRTRKTEPEFIDIS